MPSMIAIEIRAMNGAGPAEGTAEVVHRPLGTRLRQSLMIFGGGLLVGLVFLPIPLIHLFGILAFLAGIILAFRRFRTTTLLTRAAGRCPSCDHVGQLFVGAGLRAARWPFHTSCHSCGVQLRLNPGPAGARGS
jgi:hypothetical protein